jgi:hypothetical protein
VQPNPGRQEFFQRQDAKFAKMKFKIHHPKFKLESSLGALGVLAVQILPIRAAHYWLPTIGSTFPAASGFIRACRLSKSNTKRFTLPSGLK